jgi:hypothetical protein
MGLEMKSGRGLWKDRAIVELNVAILHSFAESRVTMGRPPYRCSPVYSRLPDKPDDDLFPLSCTCVTTPVPERHDLRSCDLRRPV